MRESASDGTFHNGVALLNRRVGAGQLIWKWTSRVCRLSTGALSMANASDLKGLMTFLRRDEWRAAFKVIQHAHFFVACHNAGVGAEEIASILGEDAAMTLWGCTFEDFLSRDLPGGRNMVDDYLKRRGYKESSSAKAYMRAIRGSVMSLYEVSGIVPDQSFLARDLIRGGDPVRVSERSASTQLKPWDRIGARIVPLRGTYQMCGGLLVYELEISEQLLAKFRWFEARVEREMHVIADELGTQFDSALYSHLSPKGALLEFAAPIFTRIWLSDALDRALNPRPLQLYNSDGDALVLCTLRFPLEQTTSQDMACAALAIVDDLRVASDTFFNWVGPEISTSELPANLPGHVIMSSLSEGGAVLGSIEVGSNQVVVTTNSLQRAERAKLKFGAALTGLIGAPTFESETPEEALAKKEPSAGDESVDIAHDVKCRIIHSQLDEHYRQTLDKPLAILDGMTPRQAAQEAASSDKVTAWLKYLENQSHNQRNHDDPLATYDVAWLWTELGIPERRV
jgi:hypothetical protein